MPMFAFLNSLFVFSDKMFLHDINRQEPSRAAEGKARQATKKAANNQTGAYRRSQCFHEALH